MVTKIALVILALLSAAAVADAPDAQISAFSIDNVSVDADKCMTSFPIEDRLFACHRFDRGHGYAVFIRAYVPSRDVDNDAFFKTTIFFKNKPPIGKNIEISSNEVSAFESYGSSSFPASSGCYGKAKSGEVRLTNGADGELVVSYKLTFDISSPHGYKSECRSPDVVTRTFKAKPINFTDLNSWLGLKTKPDSWNESHSAPHPG